MIETITKRSGDAETFEMSKVEQAVVSAAKEAGVDEEKVSSAVSAAKQAVEDGAGDRTEVSSAEVRGWALSALDGAAPDIAAAWRAYDERSGK